MPRRPARWGGCSLGGSGHLGGPSQWEVLLTGVSAQLEGL